MKLLRQLLTGLSVAAILAGCATAGTDFSRVENERLELGTTTYQSIRNQLGTPQDERSVTENGREFTKVAYSFVEVGGEALVFGTIPQRVQTFYFNEQELVGYQYFSSFKSDNTDFDKQRVPEIQEGASTYEDVISLLGQPFARYIYPMIPREDGEDIAYLYSHVRGPSSNMKQYIKRLTIRLDGNGTVLDFQFVESGEK